jgi:predicted amidophosphoribosyltransferase
MVIKEIPNTGAWDYAVSLDKHTIRSVPIGPNNYGHMQFDTERTEVGEAVFQLKYRTDFNQVELLANSVVSALEAEFPKIDVVIPMPASKKRDRQPVHEVAKRVAEIIKAHYSEDTLIKVKSTGMMKDLNGHDERTAALEGCFEWRDEITEGPWNVLLIDDLYDSGASLNAACAALQSYANIKKIYVIALTRRA